MSKIPVSSYLGLLSRAEVFDDESGASQSFSTFPIESPGVTVGLWTCKRFKFEKYTQENDEICLIVRGRVRLKTDTSSLECSRGDICSLRRGDEVVWEILDDCVKLYITFENGKNVTRSKL